MKCLKQELGGVTIVRDTKFRAFDVYNKQMLNVDNLDFTEGEVRIKTDMYSDYFSLDDMILMQYTGLKDKNGVEIYEGDIVQQDGGYVFSVEYSEEYCQYVTRSSIDFIFDNEPLTNLTMDTMNIIGNIYNNPEFTKNEKIKATNPRSKKYKYLIVYGFSNTDTINTDTVNTDSGFGNTYITINSTIDSFDILDDIKERIEIKYKIKNVMIMTYKLVGICTDDN